MAIPYQKPYLTINDQLALLQKRGMRVTDTSKAIACLQRIGYYRLSGYWYPFRISQKVVLASGQIQTTVLDDFIPGIPFSQILELYVFDKKLRLLILDAIERIEVALRVDIALTIGCRSMFAHREPNELHGNFGKKINPKSGTTDHAEWLKRLDLLTSRSKEDFVKHYDCKYRPPLPIWMAVELWDFGTLSIFFGGMKVQDRSLIAAKYDLSRFELLESWLFSLNHLRNICAHHSRLWNRVLDVQPKLPKAGELATFDHLAIDKYATHRLYAVLCVTQHLVKKISPASSWSKRLKEHVATFPSDQTIQIRKAGFPQGWEDLPLWN